MTWNSAPAMPSPMTGHSSMSAVIRTRHRPALISDTEAHRPIRSRTTEAGASTMTSMSYPVLVLWTPARTKAAASPPGSSRARNLTPVPFGAASRSSR